MLRKLLLHRMWLPAVAVIMLVAFVPRAKASVDRYAFQGRAVGFYNWETAEPRPDESSRYRWTSGHAAWRERVEGAALTIPIYLQRSDVAPGSPVNLDVAINGVLIDRLKLESNGWSDLTYNVVQLLGKTRWETAPMLTVEFRVHPTIAADKNGVSSDERELGVGVGEFRWSGPRPG